MKLIVAVDKNWAIGKDGNLLAHIPDDMKMFRDTTMGAVIVMGRKTLDSFPGGRALDGRVNMVLSTNPSFERKDAYVYHSIDELNEALKAYSNDDIFIIGGGSVYRQYLDSCNEAYVTKIDYAYDADTYFPNLDESPDWVLESSSEEQTYFDLAYTYNIYKRK